LSKAEAGPLGRKEFQDIIAVLVIRYEARTMYLVLQPRIHELLLASFLAERMEDDVFWVS
jgi:hypothetical protein